MVSSHQNAHFDLYFLPSKQKETINYLSTSSRKSGETPEPLKMELTTQLVEKHFPEWIYIGLVGEGGSADVYLCQNLLTQEVCAFKVFRPGYGNFLQHEKTIYEILRAEKSGGVGIPGLHGVSKIGQTDILILEGLGLSIDTIFRTNGNGMFSMKTVLMLGMRMVQILQHMHSRRVYHLDFRDQNIVTGRGVYISTIFPIDFGVAAYIDKQGNNHLMDAMYLPSVMSQEVEPGSTAEKQVKACRDFDLACLMCMLMGYITPKSIRYRGLEDQYIESMRNKENWRETSTESLACYPKEFKDVIDYYLGITATEVINYAYIYELFQRALSRHRHTDDGNFDWMRSN